MSPRLLFDENLSHKLPKRLADVFPGSTHVVLLGLGTSKDVELFEFAGREGYLVVTRDRDFDELNRSRKAPPKILLLRCGNQTTAYIEAMIRRFAGEIIAMADNPLVDYLELG